jgi:hypothetical protein
VPDDYYEVYVKYLTCMELYSKVVSDRCCARVLERILQQAQFRTVSLV